MKKKYIASIYYCTVIETSNICIAQEGKMLFHQIQLWPTIPVANGLDNNSR